MRLENVLALINGTLTNTPFVKNFQNIVFDIKHLKRGDLFIAFDETMINDAIVSGAYGIIFDKPTQITDIEIAWIKVENCNEALKRLLRFELIEKDITVYRCNEIILKLALQVITDPSFIVLDGDIKSSYHLLSNIDEPTTILFSPARSDADIFTSVKNLEVSEVEHVSIIEQTLFETSFIYDNIFYERQLLSPFFIPYLEKLLHLYKHLKVNYRLKKFIPIDHFEAVFTNKSFEIKEFGTSDKVLIFEPNADLIDLEIEFLESNATWGKTIYIIPHDASSITSKNIFFYKNNEQIFEIMKNNSFHFALIAGVDKEILSQPVRIRSQLTLSF